MTGNGRIRLEGHLPITCAQLAYSDVRRLQFGDSHLESTQEPGYVDDPPRSGRSALYMQKGRPL